MGVIQKMSEQIKKTVRSWLNISPASPYNIQINETMDFETNAIRNRIWYRGDSSELEQLYGCIVETADKFKFWAAKSSPGMEIRKIHLGIPSIMVRILAGIVLEDMNDYTFTKPAHEAVWKSIEKENKFRKQLERSLKEILYIGDGAYKITIDTKISDYPILEWYPGEKIEIIRHRGRLKEVVFKTVYSSMGQKHVLCEHYGYGYIRNKLYKGDTEVPLTAIAETSIIKDWEFDKFLIMAVPLQIYESSKWDGRGGSIFDGKLDAFDALDEVFSQWMDALRSGRAKTYIPDNMVPRNPKTGEIIPPNSFDNRYIKTDTNMEEKADNKIDTEQPAIPHESYVATYVTALDACLQGIISPSTIGIDVKKLDNAEAQREKEKATLYTRNAIVEALQETIPTLITSCINSYNILMEKPIEEVDVDIPFGEYANPSFESQIETVGKGKTQGIMSIEACVEELYGDSREDNWKEAEINRLKAEQGIAQVEEPAVDLENMPIAEKFESVNTNKPFGGM